MKARTWRERGSVLLAVLAVTTVLSLLLLTLQPIMFRYATRGVEDRDRKQAELTARSGLDAITSAVLAGDAGLTGEMILLAPGAELPLNNMTLEKSGMGTLEGKIRKLPSGDYLAVVRATSGSASRTMSRELLYNSGGGSMEDLPAFHLSSFAYNGSRGLIVGNSAIPLVVSGTSFELPGGFLQLAGDLLIYENTPTVRNKASFTMGGDLYTGRGTLTIQNNAVVTIQGNTYRRQQSPISGTVSPASPSYCPNLFIITQAQKDLYDAIPSWVRSNGMPYATGMNLSGSSYYVVSASTTIDDLEGDLSASVTPGNPAYIIVRNGVTLTLNASLDSGGGTPPRVVFLLEGNAQLYLESGSTAIVYGTANTILHMRNSVAADSLFYGQLRVGTLTDVNGRRILLEYRGRQGGDASWQAGRYLPGGW